MAVTGFSGKRFSRGITTTTWAAMPFATPSTGLPQSAAAYDKASVQVGGVFGAAGSVGLEGSNDNVTYFPLHDTTGAVITFTAAGLKQILEMPLYIRPTCTAGDGTTALAVTLVQRTARL